MNEMAMRASYALSKQVPDMKRGFTISTSYGEIEVSPEEAAAFTEVARAMFAKRLEQAVEEGR
ncbi:hypothetical protein [Pseudoduganella sp. R-34]|uniref:hypothetical protein n=1 Tax=Pseudoduganella sp. R-34 TaxID=3404062 RepID=UPI003CF23704